MHEVAISAGIDDEQVKLHVPPRPAMRPRRAQRSWLPAMRWYASPTRTELTSHLQPFRNLPNRTPFSRSRSADLVIAAHRVRRPPTAGVPRRIGDGHPRSRMVGGWRPVHAMSKSRPGNPRPGTVTPRCNNQVPAGRVCVLRVTGARTSRRHPPARSPHPRSRARLVCLRTAPSPDA